MASEWPQFHFVGFLSFPLQIFCYNVLCRLVCYSARNALISSYSLYLLIAHLLIPHLHCIPVQASIDWFFRSFVSPKWFVPTNDLSVFPVLISIDTDYCMIWNISGKTVDFESIVRKYFLLIYKYSTISESIETLFENFRW